MIPVVLTLSKLDLSVIALHKVTTVMFADIPDDEAQYWTSKLEWINTMSIDEEVKMKAGSSSGRSWSAPAHRSPLSYSTLFQTRVARCRLLPPSAVSTCTYPSVPLDGALCAASTPPG